MDLDINISIHALREEGDLADATSCKVSCEISIHALREEGDAGALGTAYASNISIHALREEGDDKVSALLSEYAEFLSTPSARRATSLMR